MPYRNGLRRSIKRSEVLAGRARNRRTPLVAGAYVDRSRCAGRGGRPALVAPHVDPGRLANYELVADMHDLQTVQGVVYAGDPEAVARWAALGEDFVPPARRTRPGRPRQCGGYGRRVRA